ncbi:hypothetical protein INR49_021452 [Caranx melampygus]|nr:hypothetical protein INR49_021452 [Caranx melampygus]
MVSVSLFSPMEPTHCTLSHPAVQARSQPAALRGAGESRSPLCPSPSTFASAEHSIYFIAPLHLIELTSL